MKSLNKWKKNPDSSIENPETEVTLRDGINNHWNTSTKINQTHDSMLVSSHEISSDEHAQAS